MVTSPAEVRDIYVRLVRQAHEEVLLLLPTSNVFHRQEKIGIFDSLAQAARRGAVVQISLSYRRGDRGRPAGNPHPVRQRREGHGGRTGKGSITLKAIQQARGGNGITVLVVDKSATLVIEERDSSTPDFADAIGFATYATTGPTVNASIRFFERVMEDTELREREQALLEKEKSSRRQAQLLQDILTHDIRNFVQVSKLSVDLLRQQLDSLRLAALLDSIDDAADGTTNLIDRAKKLARITEQIPELWLLDLRSPVERSVELITQANLKRAVTVTYAPELGGWSAAQVLADDLLDEVFRNILSNAVQYTDGVDVPIAIELTEEEADLAAAAEGRGRGTRRTKCWKVAITDHGRGIDDKVKPRVFTRYQKSESGSGIGLSIVHALVVARYGGMVRVLDRVAGDPSKGTRVEVLVREARHEGPRVAAGARSRLHAGGRRRRPGTPTEEESRGRPGERHHGQGRPSRTETEVLRAGAHPDSNRRG